MSEMQTGIIKDLRKQIAKLEAELEALTEYNQNAQSLNGLLELRVEALEAIRDAAQPVVDHINSNPLYREHIHDCTLLALSDKLKAALEKGDD